MHAHQLAHAATRQWHRASRCCCPAPPQQQQQHHHHHQQQQQQQQHAAGRRTACRAAPGSSDEFEGVEAGDPALQEQLMAQLRVQIESETLKEEIKEDLKGKVEDLKQLGEELLTQLDEELGIEKFRTELESGQVLAEVNEKFNELEEQLQQIKDQIKADQAELRQFEAASANARSQGLFFRSLYQPDADADAEQQAGGGAAAAAPGEQLLDPAAARRAAAVVSAPAEGEVASPFRMYLFGAMAGVLALVVAQDLSTPEPKLALDGLYGVLGLLLGINAANEQRELSRVLAARQQEPGGQRQQQASQQPGSSGDGGARAGGEGDG